VYRLRQIRDAISVRGVLISPTRRPRTNLECHPRAMYYSEYLRNKKQAAPRIISPPTGVPSSLHIQRQRFKNSLPVVTPLSGGQMLQLSAEGVIASKGHASVCCATTITQPTTLPGTCCDLIAPTQYPRGFYGPKRPDCCPVNGPPIGGQCAPCPTYAPAPNQLVNPYLNQYSFVRRPRTQG